MSWLRSRWFSANWWRSRWFGGASDQPTGFVPGNPARWDEPGREIVSRACWPHWTRPAPRCVVVQPAGRLAASFATHRTWCARPVGVSRACTPARVTVARIQIEHARLAPLSSTART